MDKINGLIQSLDKILETLNRIESADIEDLESVRKDINFLSEQIDELNEEFKEDPTETDSPEA